MADIMDADEVFSTEINSKVVAINRIEDRELQPGPTMFKAFRLYWDWHTTPLIRVDRRN